MYSINFEPSLTKIIAKWKKSNPVYYKKLGKLLKSMMVDPRKGIGHPKPLINGNDVTYSRHIGRYDRIIYDINDDEVNILVIELEGHYEDK